MQKIILFIIGYVVFLTPLSASAEVIRSFTSDITVHTDGTFAVTETIVYDFEDADRHGIFRYIETEHPDPSTSFIKDRYVDITIDNITMDGTEVPYEIDDEGDRLFIRIGDPDVTISGPHTYEIEYMVRGGLTYSENTIDLYWDITGNDWEVPMEEVTARVVSAEDIILSERSCYVGETGSTDTCIEEAVADSGARFNTYDLAAGEEMTIAIALNPELVETLVLERTNLWIPWLIFGLVWIFGLVYTLYRYATVHKQQRSVVVQYEPYDGLLPMYTGVLFDGRLDAHDITAGIVYLAEQGFFKIKRTDKKVLFFFEVDDYEITLNRPYSELTSKLQKKIFTLLFDAHAEVGATVSLSDLKKNTSQQHENFKTLQSLRSAAAEDLIKDGLFESTTKNILRAFLITVSILVLILIVTFGFGLSPAHLLIPAAILLVITFIGFAIVYRRRTQKGYEALHHLKGFKLFLSVTDKERFAFHNAPAKSPEQFMEYLPYAIAFGVEKEWAEVFNGITIPEPDWYDGGGYGSFSAIHLSSSLGAFGTTFSSSSGTSASSGGGGAGGGAGGGGGGSW